MMGFCLVICDFFLPTTNSSMVHLLPLVFPEFFACSGSVLGSGTEDTATAVFSG